MKGIDRPYHNRSDNTSEEMFLFSHPEKNDRWYKNFHKQRQKYEQRKKIRTFRDFNNGWMDLGNVIQNDICG